MEVKPQKSKLYTHTHTHTHTHIYIYIEREREREMCQKDATHKDAVFLIILNTKLNII
jgi:hypothetical protein